MKGNDWKYVVISIIMPGYGVWVRRTIVGAVWVEVAYIRDDVCRIAHSLLGLMEYFSDWLRLYTWRDGIGNFGGRSQIKTCLSGLKLIVQLSFLGENI